MSENMNPWTPAQIAACAPWTEIQDPTALSQDEWPNGTARCIRKVDGKYMFGRPLTEAERLQIFAPKEEK